ncbi:hypothetical protein QLX67_06360 [Balneolaceae bacterium ANBcel3]|nr:hypothetical protein [Balneolaceae bacterium ANBcel3]
MLPTVAWASHPLLVSFNSSTQDTDIILSWEVSDHELTNEHFQLRRRYTHKGSGDQALDVNRIESAGAGRFSYRDRDLFKSDGENPQAAGADGVIYELYLIRPDGSRELMRRTETLQYTTNAARSTWGNIKSMFQ